MGAGGEHQGNGAAHAEADGPNFIRHYIRMFGRLPVDGAEIFDTPAQAAEGADVILTMVADADTVLDAMNGDDGALSADGAG